MLNVSHIFAVAGSLIFFTNLVSFKVVIIFGEFSAVAKIQLI